MSIQDSVRKSEPLNQIARTLWRWGITPNTLTISGFVISLIAAASMLDHQLPTAGLVLLLALPFDVLDGAVARVRNQPELKFGGVLDSTLDRYADGFLFLGIIIHFMPGPNAVLLVAITGVAMLGAFTTPYVRSRAEVEGVVTKVGLDRMYRLAFLEVGLFFPIALPVMLIALAVIGNASTFFRLYDTSTQLGE